MNKINIKIDWVPDSFAAAIADDTLACVATGRTLEEVEKNILDAIAFHLDGMKQFGENIPSQYQDEWEPVYILTTRAQLKYTDNYITRKELSRETGIAEQQLSHYANGQRHPRPAMQKRISDGIMTISRRLAFIL